MDPINHKKVADYVRALRSTLGLHGRKLVEAFEYNWCEAQRPQPREATEYAKQIVTFDDARIEDAKREILADIQSHLVPDTVERFAQLHDYVDANEYLADGDCLDTDELLSAADAVVRALDAWLRSGGHRQALRQEV